MKLFKVLLLQIQLTVILIKSQAYAPHHHIDSSDNWVIRASSGTTPYTYIDYESAVTEQNRQIKVIKPEHIRDVAIKFISVM